MGIAPGKVDRLLSISPDDYEMGLLILRSLLATVFFAMTAGLSARAEQVAVHHVQLPKRQSMVARSEEGKVLANVQFSQMVQGDEVSMRLTYSFVDGSIDEETTTFKQQGTFRFVRNHHIEKGPFFARPVDFEVEAAPGTAITRTADKNGKVNVESEHIDLPDDLANGFIGTLLLNLPQDFAPFRVGLLAPVRGGRLVRLLISAEGEEAFHMAGQVAKARIFRVHPELGGIVGVIAQVLGLQPKDVMVWVSEGEDPSIVKIVGQLGGYGPLITSELVGTSFGK